MIKYNNNNTLVGGPRPNQPTNLSPRKSQVLSASRGTGSMEIVDTPSTSSRRLNNTASAAATAPRSTPGGAFMYHTTPQSRTILLACKLPGHNNIISCIVNRDALVEGAASHIKDQAKANFGIELPPVENIRLSTTTRFGYAIPLGRNETVGNYFPAFDGEVLVTTSGNGNAASPKKRKRKKSTASAVTADVANRIAQLAKPSPQSPKKKKQKKKKKPAAAASKQSSKPTSESDVDLAKQAGPAKRKKAKQTSVSSPTKGKSSKGNKKGGSSKTVADAQTNVGTTEGEPAPGKKKPRKPKKPKDPNAPKKPMATFIRFRQAMNGKKINGKKMELSDISAAWKSEAYATKRKAIEKEFAKEMKKYKAAEAAYLKKQQNEAEPITGPKSAKKTKVVTAARSGTKEQTKPVKKVAKKAEPQKSASGGDSSSSSSSGSDSDSSSSSSSSDSDSSSDDEAPAQSAVSKPSPPKPVQKKRTTKAIPEKAGKAKTTTKKKKAGSKRKVDPNAPKRPANVFMRFSDYLRKEKSMKNDLKNFSVSIPFLALDSLVAPPFIANILAFQELYKQADFEPEMKKKFQAEYKKDYAKYVSKRDAYNASKDKNVA